MFFTTVVGLPTPPVIDGGRIHHVARNMEGTSAPSTKNFLRNVPCCNTQVAVTRLPRMLRRQLMKHSAKKSCASLEEMHETQTRADVCANSSSLTEHSTQSSRTMFYPNIKLHARTLLTEVRMESSALLCERVFAAVVGTSTPPVVKIPWRKQHGTKTRTEHEERLHDVEHM